MDHIMIGVWLEVWKAPGGNVVIAESGDDGVSIAIERADIPDLIRALIKLQDPEHPWKPEESC